MKQPTPIFPNPTKWGFRDLLRCISILGWRRGIRYFWVGLKIKKCPELLLEWAQTQRKLARAALVCGDNQTASIHEGWAHTLTEHYERHYIESE